MSTSSAPQALRLPNGLTLWARCEWRARDGHRAVHAMGQPEAPAPSEAPKVAAPEPTTASLRETEHQTVVRVLAECEGNVSKAARALGVSRGRIYRHLRPAG
jgi:transcriptional regulator of acetoin/glycerol metabolism